ncbi:MAG: hypothetical protein FJ088_15765, partial [Deltaproteobacteria bacterium]|nr:hypothetical protein [Deltaproteobacteria bacterium]
FLISAGGIVFLFGGGVKFAKKLLLTGIGLVLPVSFFLVTSGISAPMDERVYYYKVDFDRSHPAPFKLKGKDTPDYVEWDRRRYDLRLFPDLRFGQFHSALVRLKLNQFTDELARPSVREYERPFMDYLPALLTGGLDAISPVSIYKVLELNVPRKNLYPFQMYKAEAKSGESYSCVELVLKESPALAAKPLVPGCMNPGMEPLVMDGRASYIINGLRAGWGGEEYPLRIIAARDRFGTINLAIAPYEPEDIEPFDEMNLIEVDASHLKQASIPLLLPQNTLIRITDTPLGAVDLNYLSYTRNSIIEPEGVWISEATPYSD